MTVSEAAEIIGLDVRVWARQNARVLTIHLVEGRVSELQHSDSLKGKAAKILAGNRNRMRRAMRFALDEE